jgi:hypothetical protein
MILHRKTKSLCPVCLAEIPAIIQVDNESVKILKHCREHGETEGLIEKDPVFYMLCSQLNRGTIYGGLFIDATNRCNTTCKYCYHDASGAEPTAEDILTQCRENKNLSPFILVGGEPTVRDDLPQLIRDMRGIGPVMISTNGLKLADRAYIDELDGLRWPGMFNASISLHPESSNSPEDYEKKIIAIDNVASTDMMLYGLIFVIDSLAQIDEAILINQMFRGKVCETRLKIASNVSETSDGSGLFPSDVYNYLYAKAKTEGVNFEINHEANNKVVYFNMIYDGIKMTVVKWFDRTNVDLVEIDCGPWHRNKNGRFLNMGHSLILGG